jgi:hypothetical protein
MASRKALVVGIDKYTDPRNNLNSCVNDATRAAALFRDSYGFEVRNLHDEQATLAKLRENLDWLFQNATGDDCLVLYYSAHGFQFPEGGNLEECLITHDVQFFRDNELASRTQGLPSGILTCIFDTCHSGGQFKALFLPDDSTVELVMTKAWQPTAEQSEQLKEAAGTVKTFKFFGAAPTSDPEVAAKGFALDGDEPTKAGDELGQLEMKGLLLAACLEDETALAGSAKTDGLSAYTFFLLKALQEVGLQSSADRLHSRATDLLKVQGFRQTPFLKVPVSSPNMASQTFLTLQAAKAATPADGLVDALTEAIREALSNLGKEFKMTTTSVGAAPTLDQDTEKFLSFLGPIIRDVLPVVVNGVVQAISGQGKAFVQGPQATAPQPAGGQLTDEDAEKFLGFLGPVLGAVLPGLIGAVGQAISGQGKAFVQGPQAAPQPAADQDAEKFLGFLGPVLGAVLPGLIGAVGQAISGGQGKSILGPGPWSGWGGQPTWGGGWGGWGVPRPTPQTSPFVPAPTA